MAEGFSAFFETVLINLWCGVFVSSKQARRKEISHKYILIQALVFFVLLVNNLYSKNAMIAIGITWGCSFIVFLQYDYDKKNSLLLALYFCALVAFCDMLAITIINLYTNENIEILKTTLGFRFLGSISSKFMTLTIFRIIYSKKYLWHANKNVSISFITHLLILPIISLIIINQLVIIQDPLGVGLSFQNFFITLGLLAANLFEFNFFIKEQKYEYIKYKNKFLEAEIKTQINQYEMLQNANYEIRKVRHDLKNILIALLGLVNNRENDEAKKFINKQLDVINDVHYVIRTGYYSIDNLVNYKIKQAKKLNSDFSCIISLKKNEVKIDEMDICIILGNAIDNALEEVQKITDGPKEIGLEMRLSNGFLIIVLQNTCRSNVSFHNGILETTKMDKINHGLGINTIQTISSYYNGYCDFNIVNGIFISTITLINDKK